MKHSIIKLESVLTVRNNIYIFIFSTLIIWFCSSSVYAQKINNGGAGLYQNNLLDSRELEKPDGHYVTKISDSTKWQKPTVAFFKSMIFPGWGQLSNRQYIKAGIVIGTEAALIGTLVHYAKKTSDAKKAFDLASGTEDDILIFNTFNAFDKAKDNRNLFSWLSGAFVFLSMFDAYVDAHLAQFPKYDKSISLQINYDDTERIKAVLALEF